MQFQYSPYMLPLITAAIISGWVAAYAWRQRATRSAPALAILALAIMEWTLGYALEIAGADLPTKEFWGKIQYLGIVTVPLMWLIFAYEHSHQSKRLARRNMLLLSVVPLITFVLALTTDLHGLIWKEIGLKTAADFSALSVSYGFWFWVHSAYSYLLLLLGSIFVVQSISRMQGLYRSQAVALLVGVLAPWVGNTLYLSGLSPVPHLDLTPFAFTLTVGVIAWSILGFRLIDLSPIARDRVVEDMNDGMIVFDAQNQIVDINPAAQRMIDLSASQAIGRTATEAFSTWPRLAEHYSHVVEVQDEITLGDGEDQRWYELRLSPLTDQRRRVSGRVVTLRNITERKRVEDRLLQERNLLRTVIDNVPDQIFVRDTECRFLLCNRSDARAMGVADPETLLGKTDFDYYPSDLAAQFQADDMAVMQSGQPILNREERGGESNGLPRWTLTTKVPLLDRQGKIAGLVGIARDVTERKQAEEFKQAFLEDMKALRELHLALSEIDDLETLYIKMIDLSQRYLGLDRIRLFLLDEPANQILGTYSVDQDGQPCDERNYHETITPDHWTLDILHAPDHAKLWDDTPHLNNGRGVDTNWKVGAALWNGHHTIGYLVGNIHSGKSARPYESELISLLGSTCGHLIERQRANEQLRQLSRAVEASPASIVITDTAGGIQYVNPKFTQVTGYSLQEALGQNPRILKTDQTPLERHQQLWQTITSGQEWRGEFCNRKKNGELYWESASISPITDAVGNITHYVAVKEDITERKRAQDELAIARDQAVAASRYKTELVAKVSHELRTPLGAIVGYAELLHAEKFAALTPQQKHFTAEILDSGAYLNGLINDLLDQSQIERGKIEIHPAPFEVRQLVDQLTVSLKPQAEAKGLSFMTEVESDLPNTLVGDEKRVRQILTNLTNNAIKFTEAGSVAIRLRRMDARRWAMQVTDTGLGISQEAQAKIFDSFWQADSSLTRRQKGYGLGLSIVKQLADLMEGEIIVESEVGRGSAFTVVLPLET